MASSVKPIYTVVGHKDFTKKQKSEAISTMMSELQVLDADGKTLDDMSQSFKKMVENHWDEISPSESGRL